MLSFEYNSSGGWGSKLLLIIALQPYKTRRVYLTLPQADLVCAHGQMGTRSSHKTHTTKSSTCFTNALQLLHPVDLNAAKT